MNEELVPIFFAELKWLQLNGQIYIDPQTKNADGIKKTRLSEIFLFDILRVDQMSLLKFNFIIGGEEMVIHMILRIFISHSLNLKLKALCQCEYELIIF